MKKKKIWASILLFALLLVNVIPVYADTEEKKLYFEKQDGEMVWNTDKGTGENWFMSFTNMVPGESYQDKLLIENGSSKTYDLYFQIIPLEQEQLKNELLEKIEMTITQDGKQIYKGNATGQPGTIDLQNILPLGTYTPDRESEVVVDLTLDGTLGLEYCELLTQIDWKFMVQEKKGAPVIEVKPPKTGDVNHVRTWILLMISAITVVGLMEGFVRKKKKYQK